MLLQISIYFIFFSILAFGFTTKPPCCRDHLGSSACSKMLSLNFRMFSRRCNNDAEFRLVQCCSSCNIAGVGMAYDLIARSLVSEHCFDRYGPEFCGRYVNQTDVFEPHNTWSCDGKNPQIAFRACRSSCGFCNFNEVKYTLNNAIEACNSTTAKSRRWKNKFSIERLEKSTQTPQEIIDSTFVHN